MAHDNSVIIDFSLPINIHLSLVQWVVGSILHGAISHSSQCLTTGITKAVVCIIPLSYFSFQPVLNDWHNKDCGMYYPVCGMMHIKEPLLLIIKSSLCGSCRFPFSLSEWSFTICLMPYNRK